MPQNIPQNHHLMNCFQHTPHLISSSLYRRLLISCLFFAHFIGYVLNLKCIVIAINIETARKKIIAAIGRWQFLTSTCKFLHFLWFFSCLCWWFDKTNIWYIFLPPHRHRKCIIFINFEFAVEKKLIKAIFRPEKERRDEGGGAVS